jgi:hypothetical protein
MILYMSMEQLQRTPIVSRVCIPHKGTPYDLGWHSYLVRPQQPARHRYVIAEQADNDYASYRMLRGMSGSRWDETAYREQRRARSA